MVMKDGMISEQGTYQSLNAKAGDFAAFLSQHEVTSKPGAEPEEAVNKNRSMSESSHRSQGGTTIQETVGGKLKKDEAEAGDGKLVSEEEAQVGKVDKKVYLEYAKKIGSFNSVTIIFLCALMKGLMAVSDVWLSTWADLAEKDEAKAIASTRSRH